MGVDLNKLSRAVSHALRHEPWLYELELDDEGWASLEDVLSALRREHYDWRCLDEKDVALMIAMSSNHRHEISRGRIRALYGHSIPNRLRKLPGKPPDMLYHGTSPASIASILESSLLPMRRQYVHLSIDVETAFKVGKRKSNQPVVLCVSAAKAYSDGIGFYEGNENVWLADNVPPRFIHRL